jgi:hypothetical protein
MELFYQRVECNPKKDPILSGFSSDLIRVKELDPGRLGFGLFGPGKI